MRMLKQFGAFLTKWMSRVNGVVATLGHELTAENYRHANSEPITAIGSPR
jgi:hypothetical protein